MRVKILVLTLLLILPTLAAAEDHTLLRFWIESPADMAYIAANPDDLDITESGRAWQYYDIVADREEAALLMTRGGRIEVLQENLETFYASRLNTRTNFGIYHTFSEAVAWMDSLHMLYPDVVSAKWSLGQSHQGNEIWCFRVSDNPEQDENEPESLFDGLHHAREIMASEMPMMLAEYLAEKYYEGDPETVAMLDSREVYFVPIVNPDGFLYNEQTNPNGGGMWRKNRRNNGGSYGVDPNRNYPYEWGHDNGSSGNPSSETYRGPYAASEPEVQAVMALIDSHEFVVRQSWHSYSELTLYPWGYTTSDTPDEATFREMADAMVQYNGYTPGQPGDVLYVVSGGSFDWDYGEQEDHAKIFGFTNEIGSYSDGFWPPEYRRQQLFEDNLWPSLYLIQESGNLRGVTWTHAPLPYSANPYEVYDLTATPQGYGGAPIDASSVELQYRVNGGAFVPLGMSDAGGGAFAASIPAQDDGSVVEYYLFAMDDDGNTGTSPRNAPGELHYFEIGAEFAHDMEDNRGWSRGASDDDASTGIWTRVDPYPTSAQPGDDHSADGTFCWVTGQQQAGQSDGYNDVDGGKTTLFTPVFDMTEAEQLVFSYWKWYSNDQGNDPNNDYWDVALSNDGGASWTALEHTTSSTNAWVQMSFDFFDHFGQAGQVQLRFVASDEGSGSLVEAAIDDFSIAGVFNYTGFDDGEAVSFRVELHQNVPNPFNPTTSISFNLAESGPVSLGVFDANGRRIADLVNGSLPGGDHSVTWNGRDSAGNPVASGVYLYRLDAAGTSYAKQMLLVK